MKRSAWYLAFILILFSGKNSFGQSIQSNIWYFGQYAGLDFSSGTPIVLSDGQINTIEGCTAMSDCNTGRLLFYSNGRRIFNRNHVVMQNGDSLWGHFSSTQSA